jgi:hypothetical protein
MECPNCKSENPETNTFCGTCGSSLTTDLVLIRVEKILSEKFKDRALVEYEITDKIAGHFTTFLKVGAWVFAPTLALIAFFGWKTFNDASTSIQRAADTAVKEVQSRAKTADETIATSAARVQVVLDRYAAAPELQKALQAAEARVKNADARTLAVEKSARENQQKLAQIASTRAASPDTTLGQLNQNIVTPSPLLSFTIPGVTSTTSGPLILGGTPRITFKIGDTGDDVKKIQNRLKTLKCYSGEVSGTYDEATEAAGTLFKKTSEETKRKLYGSSYTPLSILGLDKPDVLTWMDLDSSTAPSCQ